MRKKVDIFFQYLHTYEEKVDIFFQFELKKVKLFKVLDLRNCASFGRPVIHLTKKSDLGEHKQFYRFVMSPIFIQNSEDKILDGGEAKQRKELTDISL
jgi:hypothetical protein